MSKLLPLINTDNTDQRKSRISELEASLLAILAIAHPRAVDAIDAFSALWQIKKIPTGSLSEAMTLLVMAMSAMEELGYARCFTDGCGVWYALTLGGASMIVGDNDIKAQIESHALMSLSRMAGGKPC